MTEPHLQQHYGRFTPRFIGISLQYDSPASFDEFVRYLTSEGPVQVDENNLHSISLISTLDHETRHFDDFLMSPYSNAIYRLRLMALRNWIQAAYFARTAAGDVLPVPLTDWVRLPTVQRKTISQEWGELIGAAEARTLMLPHLDEDELLSNIDPSYTSAPGPDPAHQFSSFAEFAVRAYARIDQLTRGFGPRDEGNHYVTPRQLHEASALNVQVMAVLRGQGAVAASNFLHFLLTSTLDYALMWQRAFALGVAIEESKPNAAEGADLVLQGVRLSSAVTTWCLLGNYQLDGTAACPAARFSRLEAALASRGDPRVTSSDMNDENHLRDMWAAWDAVTGATQWEQGLKDFLSFSERGLRHAEQTLAGEFGDKEPQWLKATSRYVLQCQQAVISKLLAQPLQIADPLAYVRARTELPVPQVRIELNTFAVHVDDLPENARVTNTAEQQGETYALSFVFPYQSEAEERVSQLLAFEGMVTSADFALSSGPLRAGIASAERRILESLTGKRVFHIV